MDAAPGPAPGAADAPDPQHPAVGVASLPPAARPADAAALEAPAAAPPTTPVPDRRTDAFRLDATNEWDRMPAEIQNKILDAAGPFTEFVNGLLLAVELRGRPKKCEQVWQDAIDVDWQGDRSKLRFSSDMFSRVAIRRGWTDMLDFDDPEVIAVAAASEGAVSLVQDMIDVRKVVTPSAKLVMAAAMHGQLAVSQFLHERTADQDWDTVTSEHAATSGNLDLVVWLCETRPACLDGFVFHGAALGGHMHVARWLAEHTDIVCAWTSFSTASYRSNLEMLKFLYERFPDVLDSLEPNSRFVSDDIRVLEWLEEHDRLDLEEVTNHIGGKGNIRTLEWIMARHEILFNEWSLFSAHVESQNALLKWAYNRGVPFTRHSANWCVFARNTEIMQWIISRDRDVIPLLVAETQNHSYQHLREWWRVRHGILIDE